MATFAKTTFSAASYAAFRPVYPPALYHRVLDYHRGPERLCLDLGCGTGIVTREMGTRFTRAIGLDPSPGMIAQARRQTAEGGHQGSVDVSFRAGRAEECGACLDDEGEEADCVVAGQAAHWFDHAALWPEVARVLRSGATLAFWGYKDPALVDYPRATEILNEYCYSPGKLGPYWSMPGRRYVQELLRVVRPPEAEFEDVRRIEYEPRCGGRASGDGTVLMEKSLTVKEAKDYFRTYSAFHGWREANPGSVAKAEGGKGDMVDEIFEKMAEFDGPLGSEDQMINLEWGSVIVLARRK